MPSNAGIDKTMMSAAGMSFFTICRVVVAAREYNLVVP